MILVAGGTGVLGTQIVGRLSARAIPVRVLTRERARASHLERAGVEVVTGDVRDGAAVERAAAGAQTVVSAIHGFAGTDPKGPAAVDGQGNRHLMRAAQAARAEHFILVSAYGGSPSHPVELFRMKAAAERDLEASGLTATVIRPTAFMETWATLVGEPLLRTGRTKIFGRGRNPINFVSAHDVARLVEHAVADPSLRGATVDIGGPENLTFEQVVSIFEAESGRTGAKSHVPLTMMRALALLLRPFSPIVAGQIGAGVMMDTAELSFDPAPFRRRFPSIPLTSLAEVVRRDYLNAPGPNAPALA